MTFKIQKTIFSKFIELNRQEKATEAQVFDLLHPIKNLYKEKVLTDNDLYKHKLEIIHVILEKHLVMIKQKRNAKEIKITCNEDFIGILESDIGQTDYSKTSLTVLDKFESPKDIELSFDNVKLVLENMIIPKSKLINEQTLEKFVHHRLSVVFGLDRIYRQYSVGGFLALKSDIDVGNGQVGIELKIANSLTATDMQRMIGQLVYYKKRYYNSNLVVYIVSRSSLTPTIKELRDFIQELGISVIFSQAINI